MKKIPFGITLISLYYIIVSISLTIRYLAMREKIAAEFTGIEIVMFYILVGIAAAIGTGLWFLCNWSRYLSVLHLLLNIITVILHKQPQFNLSIILGIIIEIAIICYLFLSPKVKKAFVT